MRGPRDSHDATRVHRDRRHQVVALDSLTGVRANHDRWRPGSTTVSGEGRADLTGAVDLFIPRQVDAITKRAGRRVDCQGDRHTNVRPPTVEGALSYSAHRDRRSRSEERRAG